MITLAVMTGVSAEQWAKEGARAIATAFDVLDEMRRARGGQADADAQDPS